MSPERYAHLALRVGVSFAFLYPAIAAITDPDSWLGYFPQWIFSFIAIDPLLILHGFGIIEAVIALWILSGRHIRIPAALAAFLLLAIIAFNWSGLDVLFRDFSIACMALALALWPQARASEWRAPPQAPL